MEFSLLTFEANPSRVGGRRKGRERERERKGGELGERKVGPFARHFITI